MKGYCNSKNYSKDNVFDKFDLKEYLQKPIYIPPINKDDFLYSTDLSKKKTLRNLNNSNSNKKNSTDEQTIISVINQNHFDINIETLKITYSNGYFINFIDYYTPLSFIGQGSFGLVISVEKKETKEIFAVKIIKKTYTGFANSNISKEVEILKTLDNNRIMKLHDVIDTNEYLFLFMDLIEGGSLKDFIIDRYTRAINKEIDYFITDEEASIIIKGILEGINYIHKNNIMHRDLKPENIMFRNKDDLDSIIIGDFGIADDISYCGSAGTRCGTLIYMAPEMSDERPYDQLIDLWACGIILYILESGGKHPIYNPKMDKDMYVKEAKKKLDWKFPDYFSNLARNLFLKLCKLEPFYRYQTNKSLKHPWITRQVNGKIPLTLIESYDRDYKIKLFKSMLCCSMYFNTFKSMNENMFIMKQNTTITSCFLSPFDSPKPTKKMSQIFSLIKTSRKTSNQNLTQEELFIHNLKRTYSKKNTIRNHLHHNLEGKYTSIQQIPLVKIRRFGSVGAVHNLMGKSNDNNSGSTLHSSIGNVVRLSKERSPSVLRLREDRKSKPSKDRTPLKELQLNKNTIEIAGRKKSTSIKLKKSKIDSKRSHKYYLGPREEIDEVN